MDNLDIFYAIVEAVDPIPKEGGGTLDYVIFIKKVSSEADFINTTPIRANPPSTLPFSITGGGHNAKPVPGVYCWAIMDKMARADSRAQILTYAPHPGVSPQGMFNNEDSSDGSIVQKIGGIQKSVFKMTPSGELSLYSDQFSALNIYGNESRIQLSTKRYSGYYEGGFFKYDYFTNHSSGNEITPFYQSMARGPEVRIGSDREVVETEEISNEMATYGMLKPYVDKVIIRGGQVVNVSQTGKDALLKHVYQIETRQATLSNYKDTVSVLRLGYQAEQKNYSTSKITSAGSILEWSAKRNDPTPGIGKYSSMKLRYGKLENEDDDKAKGEVYRNQIYVDVVTTIGTPIINSVGEGIGYDFKFNNFDATQQYVESFGSLENPSDSFLKDSYWRFHIHNFNGLSLATKSTYSGFSYNEYFGGQDNDSKDCYFNKKFTHKDLGKDKITFLESFIKEQEGTFTLRRDTLGTSTNHTLLEMNNNEYLFEHVIDANKSQEKIYMTTDKLDMYVTPDGKFSYQLIMNDKKIILVINDGSKKTEIISEPTKLTINAPDEVNINTKTANVISTDKVYIETNDADIKAATVKVDGKEVEFVGNSVLIDKIIDGVTAGFSKLPICAVTGAPHTIKKVGV
jgi:hypothetical protein